MIVKYFSNTDDEAIDSIENFITLLRNLAIAEIRIFGDPEWISNTIYIPNNSEIYSRMNNFSFNLFERDPAILMIDMPIHNSNLLKDILEHFATCSHVSNIICNDPARNYYETQTRFSRYLRSLENMDYMLNIVLEHQAQSITNGSRNNHFIIIDDISRRHIQQSRELDELICTSRHYIIGYLMRVQSNLQLSPAYRANIDYVIINPHIDNYDDLMRIYIDYLRDIPEDSFFELINQLIQHNEFLVVDKRSLASNFYDRLYKLSTN